MSSASSAGPPRKKTKYINIIEEGLNDLEKLLFEDDADQTMTNADQTVNTMTSPDQNANTMTNADHNAKTERERGSRGKE